MKRVAHRQGPARGTWALAAMLLLAAVPGGERGASARGARPEGAGAGFAGSRQARAAPGSGPIARAALQVVEVHFAMWTPVLVAAIGEDEPELRRAIGAAVEEIHRLEGVHSTFDPRSAASRLNASAGAGWTEVGPDLTTALDEAARLSAASGGSFSVLVGPLVDLWRHAVSVGRWPAGIELLTLARIAGPAGVEVSGSRARLLDPRMRVELGGFAKGIAADRALAVLRERGARSALVNLGGSSMAAFGAGPDGAGWPVDLPDGTRAARDGCPRGISLRDQGLSTSHSRGRRWSVAGRTVGHILDPRSGLPVEDDAHAVVLHPSATVAEALSKAVLVLGRERGLERVEALGGEGFLLYPDREGDCSRRSVRSAESGPGRATMGRQRAAQARSGRPA